MRKFVSLLLALMIVFSMAGVAFATEIPAEQMSPEEEVPIIDQIVPFDVTQDFSSLAKQNYVHCGECQVTQGVTKLKITSCTWLPTYDIEIGFYSNSTLNRYGVVYSGGKINNSTITTKNVPSGSYWIYIRNNGNGTISSGSLFYNVID